MARMVLDFSRFINVVGLVAESCKVWIRTFQFRFFIFKSLQDFKNNVEVLYNVSEDALSEKYDRLIEYLAIWMVK